MAVKQLSAFIENTPGSLKNTIAKISDSGVNIRAMSIADTKDYGILRLIVSDFDRAKEAICDSTIAVATDVIAVEINDETGSLSKVLGIINDAGENIDYLYAFTAPTAHGAYVVLRVDDVAKTEKILASKGVAMLNDEDIKSL